MWLLGDRPRIDLSMITHQLNIDPSHLPVKQKQRAFTPKHYKAFKIEVNKLLKARFIKEVGYPIWLSNVVIVKKANRKLQVCIDFIDFKKAHSKDCFSLLRINQLVDAMTGL